MQLDTQNCFTFRTDDYREVITDASEGDLLLISLVNEVG